MAALGSGPGSISGRYVTLDGMRGVAALCVMLLHAENLSPFPMPGGYLAVDLFLVLSGFVIAGAYGPRMARLGVSGLMRLRFIRLYPLYFCGLMLGALALALQTYAKGASLPIWSLVTGLFLLPAVKSSYYLYPVNPPSWSLGFEVLVNFGYGLLGYRRNGVLLALILLTVSAALITHETVRAGNANLGAEWFTANVGLARSVFSFTLGVLLFQLVSRWAMVRQRSLLSPLAMLALIFVLALPMVWRAGWDLFCIFAVFPALVLLGAIVEPRSGALPEFLGDISYSLYCIHFPLLVIGRAVISRLGFDPVIAGPALLCAIVLLSFVLHRCIDVPLRAGLALRLGKKG